MCHFDNNSNNNLWFHMSEDKGVAFERPRKNLIQIVLDLSSYYFIIVPGLA